MKPKIAVLLLAVLLCLTTGCNNASHIAETPDPISSSDSNIVPSEAETAQEEKKTEVDRPQSTESQTDSRAAENPASVSESATQTTAVPEQTDHRTAVLPQPSEPEKKTEGYLLDSTVHKVGAEPQLYTVEHNQTANDVTEQVVKGNIAIIKHTDNGDTQIETPESGAEFAVYLKAAGSYEVAEDTERDYLTCDENGFAQTKDMPYGIYTVHQVSGWEGSKLMPDFDVFISQNGATYRYLINNAPFNSFIKIVKQDAETGKTIPYAGAGFKIYDPDGNPVTMTFTYPTPTTIDVFYTNAEGSLVTPEKLSFGKGYSIVEVQAPYGYVLDETPVYFDVTEDNSTEESGVTVYIMTNAKAVGMGTEVVITFYKR